MTFGSFRERPISECSCLLAIAEYERQYHRAKWHDDDDASSPGNTTGAASSSKASKTEGEGSEYDDDGHLDYISSDNSLWADMEDEFGRPGTDPEGMRLNGRKGRF